MRSIAFIVSILIVYSTPAFSEIFRWTDAGGTMHFTDERAGIPSKYRNKAVSIGGNDEAMSPNSAVTTVTIVPDVNTGTKSREDSAAELKSSKVSKKSELDILANSLQQNAVSDKDKAYAIFSWIRANIYYDNAAKWQRRYGREGADQSPAGVLASKKAVCEGMANLFSALANKMGLQSEVVTGTASGMRQERHAWNAVMINGNWGLIDITRHSFLNPPQEFLARHFPDNPHWQLSDKPLTYQEWLHR